MACRSGSGTPGSGPENWKRDAGEVTRLFAMLDEELRSAPYLDHGVRLRWLGYPDRLPWELVQTLRRNETGSRDQRTLTLTLCVNYGGRAEILHGAAAVARSVLAGDAMLQDVTAAHGHRSAYPRCMDAQSIVAAGDHANRALSMRGSGGGLSARREPQKRQATLRRSATVSPSGSMSTDSSRVMARSR